MPTDVSFESARRRPVFFAAALVLTALGFGAGIAWAAPAQLCAKGLYCFSPDAPAMAGEVNGNFAAVAVGVGSIIAHTTNLAGAETITEMQARGFALCDGTTPASQGIMNALITAATPNLNGGRFLRGGSSAQSGTLEDDATAANGLTITLNDTGHDHLTIATDNCNNFNGDFTVGTTTFRNVGLSGAKRAHFWDSNQNCNSGHYTTARSQTGITVGTNGGDSETRPTNMRVVWMMRVR